MKCIIGGIGDIFLSLQKAQEEGECIVYSHFPRAKEFVESFGVKVPYFKYFKNIEEMPKIFNEEILGHDYFPDIGIQRKRNLLFKSDKPLIGVHPFGSNFSNEYWKKRGMPIKHISKQNINHLVNKFSDKFNFVIFGSKEELSNYKIHNAHNVNLPIEDIPSAVSECYCVIATDSAIKTFSAAMRIPTYVAVGNYKDQLRDEKFLLPYIQMGIIKASLYSNIQNLTLAKDVEQWINLL